MSNEHINNTSERKHTFCVSRRLNHFTEFWIAKSVNAIKKYLFTISTTRHNCLLQVVKIT